MTADTVVRRFQAMSGTSDPVAPRMDAPKCVLSACAVRLAADGVNRDPGTRIDWSVLQIVEHPRSHYSILLQERLLQRTPGADSGARQPQPHAFRARTSRGQRIRRTILPAIVLTVVVAVATAIGLAGSQPLTTSSMASNHFADGLPVPIQLAHAFTAVLNERDVTAVVDLFADDDSNPTVKADRFAWQKFEICQWALLVARGGPAVFAEMRQWRG